MSLQFEEYVIITQAYIGWVWRLQVWKDGQMWSPDEGLAYNQFVVLIFTFQSNPQGQTSQTSFSKSNISKTASDIVWK